MKRKATKCWEQYISVFTKQVSYLVLSMSTYYSSTELLDGETIKGFDIIHFNGALINVFSLFDDAVVIKKYIYLYTVVWGILFEFTMYIQWQITYHHFTPDVIQLSTFFISSTAWLWKDVFHLAFENKNSIFWIHVKQRICIHIPTAIFLKIDFSY